MTRKTHDTKLTENDVKKLSNEAFYENSDREEIKKTFKALAKK